MNVLFMTLNPFKSLNDHTIYTDLLSEFTRNHHHVYAITPIQKGSGATTKLTEEPNCSVLQLEIGRMSTSNIIRKGISTVMIAPTYKKAVQQYFNNVKFDLILYSTPPITLCSVIAYVKRRDHARTYLMLKDIFPQNAVDLGMMRKSGPKSILYWFFRYKEKQLYRVSDNIGCMSEANVKYLLDNNPTINPKQVGICPNSIEVIDKSIDKETRRAIREQYGIPQEKKVFVYGGNLGKPQGIPFIIECLKQCATLENVFFLIVGGGTEYNELKRYADSARQANFKLLKSLPKEDYDTLVAAADVGLIFLDHRFTIPNFPSRMLGYMQAKLPILACTDPNTDIGRVIVDGGFGWWCESNDVDGFRVTVEKAINCNDSYSQMSWDYLQKNYSVKVVFNQLLAQNNNLGC